MFFFSSRRRHTRCGRDWSSDVCSSDLLARQSARHRENVNGVGSLENDSLNFPTGVPVARAKGAGRLEVEEDRIQQVTDEEPPRRPVAVDVVGEVVAARIFDRLSAELAGEAEVIHREKVELAFS